MSQKRFSNIKSFGRDEVFQMIYIRSDMNQKIATGHMMRCLSIADAIRELGDDVIFILADHNAVALLNQRGFSSIVLDSKWDGMEGELPRLLEVIRMEKVRTLLIDSYYVTEAYLFEVSKYTHTVYLDDLNAFHYPVHSLLCYANYYKRFAFESKYKDVNLFLGTEYVPLRSEFRHCSPKMVRDEVRSLLLLSGGADPYGIMPKLLKNLCKESFAKLYAICGRYNENYDRLVEMYADDNRIHVLQSVDNLKAYMERADMAISAAGSTLYELCAVGTPTISYTFADNQIRNAVQFQEDGMIPYAGDVRTENVIENVLFHLSDFAQHVEKRRKVSACMQMLVDGRGAGRLAKALLKIDRGQQLLRWKRITTK